LNEKIRGIKKRRDLKQIIAQRRIFVSTVASMASKHELFQLKKFHRVIIDEASQVLEPMLVGLLPKFERFILIGDHKQLPAVVVQDVESSSIVDEDLQGIGLNNMRNSLFERLFKLCKQQNWDWAYAQLSHQGRMHQDIMAFPNQYFYENTLHILPSSLKFHEKQVKALPTVEGIVSPLFDQLSDCRISFFGTPCDHTSITLKTNQFEAEKIGDLVEYYLQYFRQQGKEITKNSIGIITPYRAQIAQIKSTLEAKKAPLDLLTIDTVERYQGGAREVILISLCTNVERQLRSLVSVSEEGGVDRKLNVALTRAREHVVILGNPDILKLDPIYRALMEFCGMNKL
jgi:DNA replication ATP-dependent helicase Dna2